MILCGNKAAWFCPGPVQARFCFWLDGDEDEEEEGQCGSFPVIPCSSPPSPAPSRCSSSGSVRSADSSSAAEVWILAVDLLAGKRRPAPARLGSVRFGFSGRCDWSSGLGGLWVSRANFASYRESGLSLAVWTPDPNLTTSESPNQNRGTSAGPGRAVWPGRGA